VANGSVESPTTFPLLAPLQLRLMMFAGWANRHQGIIEYLKEETRMFGRYPITARQYSNVDRDTTLDLS